MFIGSLSKAERINIHNIFIHNHNKYIAVQTAENELTFITINLE